MKNNIINSLHPILKLVLFICMIPVVGFIGWYIGNLFSAYVSDARFSDIPILSYILCSLLAGFVGLFVFNPCLFSKSVTLNEDKTTEK